MALSEATIKEKENKAQWQPFYLILLVNMNLQRSRRSNDIDNTLANKLTFLLFIVYLIALFWILLFKLGVRFSYMENRSVNLVPFRETLMYGKINVSEIILNIVIFVPLGIYVGVLSKRWKFGIKLFSFFLVSLMFEVLQYILRVGAFDITDIITNTTGGIIGLTIFVVIEKVFNDGVKAQNFINMIATIGTVVMISLLLLLKMNMLPVRYQ
jgi:glycopeptide antibiotics resistance protein